MDAGQHPCHTSPATALPEPEADSRRTRRRPVAPADARREGAPADERIASHRTPRHPPVGLVERGPSRRGPQRRGHRVPVVHRHGLLVRRRTAGTHLHRRERRGTRQEHPAAPRGETHWPLPVPVVLDSQHQRVPRPAMGTRTGDLRRRPLPERTHGTARGARTAGRALALLQAACLCQALCGTQRSGEDAPPL